MSSNHTNAQGFKTVSSCKDTKVSLFIGGKKEVSPKGHISVSDISKIARSKQQQELTGKTIAEPDPIKQQHLKAKSSFITPYGTFSYRNNESIITHNYNMVAFDFDGMKTSEVLELMSILTANVSCIICFKSPRQKGVKALFLINDAIPLKQHYEALKANALALLEAIGAADFIKFLDYSQFKLSQPLYLSYDPNFYENLTPKPLKIKLILPQEKEIENFIIREWKNTISENKKGRILAYLNTAVDNLCMDFEFETGDRHPNIAKVKGIAGLITMYSIPYEAAIYDRLENSIVAMYGSDSEAKAGNAYKSMRDAWDAAEPLYNETIEAILNEQESQPITANLQDANFRNKYRINVSEAIPPPQVALYINDEIFGTLGNFSLITGKAKAKKSFLISMAVAAALTDEVIHGILKSELPANQNQVLFFDTEQGKYHVQKAVKRICEQIGVLEPENLHAFHLRSLTPAERLQFIEAEIYSSDSIGVVIIDGIKDLITSINDEGEATMIASKLLKWSEERNIHILTVLHQNKGDNNARGHIGSEMINKAETVLSVTVVEKDKEVSIVEAQQTRNKEPEPFAFKINSEGIPYIISDYEAKPVNSKISNIYRLQGLELYEVIAEAFKGEKLLKYADLVRKVKEAYIRLKDSPIGDNKAKDLISICKGSNFVKQTADKQPYTLLQFTENDDLI